MPLLPNRLKEYYKFFQQLDKKKHSQANWMICYELGITRNCYCRKVCNPQSFSPAEKTAIAKVYQLPLHFLFPETEKIETI